MTNSGRLEVEIRSAELLTFLARTGDVVPLGTEPDRDDLDELVGSLLP